MGLRTGILSHWKVQVKSWNLKYHPTYQGSELKSAQAWQSELQIYEYYELLTEVAAFFTYKNF